MSFFGRLFNKSSDKWVFIGSNDCIADYYDPTSVKIDKEYYSIKVTCKRVYTTKGKKILFEFREPQGLSNNDINYIDHSLNSYILDYNEMTKTLLMLRYVSKSGKILEVVDYIVDSDSNPEPTDIKPGTVDDMILNKILKEYNIHIDDWVHVFSDENCSWYYKSSSVEIDNQSKIIKVCVDSVYTKDGKVKIFGDINTDIEYTLIYYIIDYNNNKSCITHATLYSKSGNKIEDGAAQPNWKDIKPYDYDDVLLNKLINDYNIQR